MRQKVVKYIMDDWTSHPFRLIMETINWIGTVFCGLFIALTVPHTPFGILYPIWFCLMSISVFSSWSRGSFGVLLASVSMLAIDIFGYVRFLTQ